MAPTPSSAKSNHGQSTQLRTPQSRHRLNFNGNKPHPSPNPNNFDAKETPLDHPVEVIARIRDYPDRKDKPLSVLHVSPDCQSIRVRADFGYRDFVLDGVSFSEEQDLDSFYKKFVESRVHGVRIGEKCTIMMFGPTGSGKSHTMFGSSKQAGIVYRSLKDILGDYGNENSSDGKHVGIRAFVQVSVLEIYNEDIYDLLSSNGGGGLGLGWPKGNNSKVKLEVMGKKAKNATYISGTEAAKLSKEIQKVEKRRIVKSTLCNDRSSRSHCMIIVDVPTVGGRLMLVDMAGSENIEQAGQIGCEAKMQTAKINQGNIALKRVVESIAYGDSHVPFRDSKLTMLLQDSFEDDKSKILMILCASPDPKDIHKTISTLEYGAKAKCIIRGPYTPNNHKAGGEDSSSGVILGSRIAAMDEFIFKLQRENKIREQEKNEARSELLRKEEEVAALRAQLQLVGDKGTGASEEEINLKVNERTELLKQELEKKLEECQRMANEFVELERRRLEERILQQQQEVEMLRKRLEEIESEISGSRDGCEDENETREMDASGFARRLLRIYGNEEDPGMVKSMELDMDDDNEQQPIFSGLSTVYEEEEGEEEEEREEKLEDEEVQKEVIEEKVYKVDQPTKVEFNPCLPSKTLLHENSDDKDATSSRMMRIQNIFTLCGNNRELSQQNTSVVAKKNNTESPLKVTSGKPSSVLKDSTEKENLEPRMFFNNPTLVERLYKFETCTDELRKI